MDYLPVLVSSIVVVAGVAALVSLVPARVASAVRALLAERLDTFERAQERLERAVREEISKNRSETSATAHQLREEVRQTLKDSTDSTLRSVGAFGERLDGFTAAVEGKLAQSRAELGEALAQLRAELTGSTKGLGEALVKQVIDLSSLQKAQLDGFAGQLTRLTDSIEKRLEALRATVDERLKAVQEENAARLEQMRLTVDEKLQGTLEKRLGESFKLVSERLEAVQRGLGEMQTLANGVGDLKRVLANVKIRGTWGEVQLGSLLEQLLAPEQLATNVATKPGSAERVEFAIRLPGHDLDGSEVLLPIDAKFPIEDYQRIVDAAERGDGAAVEEASRALEQRIKGCARDIHDKYLNPPATTDFAILFLPTEGLYAEVVRRAGLTELLQREDKVVVAGPTTLAALLNSLQMGFRTLAIQKRSSEVWQVLGAVKTEFGKFGQVIEKVDRKLQEASSTLETVATRSRAIQRKLRTVQELPAPDAEALLAAPGVEPVEEDAPV
jgi:DNA recombination protein RmuC